MSKDEIWDRGVVGPVKLWLKIIEMKAIFKRNTF